MASTSLYLDKRRARSDGTFPVKIKVSFKGNRGFLMPTSVRLRENQWTQKSVTRHPNRDKINSYLLNRVYRVDAAILELEMTGRIENMLARDIKSYVESALTGIDTDVSFIEHFDAVIDRQQKTATRNTYKCALQKVRAFDSRNLLFTDISPVWLGTFETHLKSQGLAVNSIALYIRNIRAVMNDAINKGIVSPASYPFRAYKIKLEQTRHRALTVNQLCAVRNSACTPAKRRYRDLFMLMFYLGGMDVIDLCHLTAIEPGDYIVYRRAKTGKIYNIHVEPEARDIINKYKGRKYLIDALDRPKTVFDFNMLLNQSLSAYIPGVTSKWARHTWATIAASLNIPKDTIAAVLGHGAKTVTDIYIAIDQRRIDRAIRKVIDYVNLMS